MAVPGGHSRVTGSLNSERVIGLENTRERTVERSVVSRQSRGDSRTVERRTLNVHLTKCFRRRTRRVLVSLVVEPTVVSPQQSVKRGSTSDRSGRAVQVRRPVSEDARCDPKSSRTSGLSPGSGDPWDRRSTVDTYLVLFPGRQIAWSACVERRPV